VDEPTVGLTPSQTVGPFLHIGLAAADLAGSVVGPNVVPPGTPGRVVISGFVVDGDGAGLPDALVETWQADPAGRFPSPPGRPRGPLRLRRGRARRVRGARLHRLRPGRDRPGRWVRDSHGQAGAAADGQRRVRGAAPRRVDLRTGSARPRGDPDLLRRRGGG